MLTGRQADEVEGASRKLGENGHGLVADASVPKDPARIITTVVNARERVNLLVLNAGLSEPATILDETIEHFDQHFGVSVRGMVFGLKAALPALAEGGLGGINKIDRGPNGYLAL